VGTRAGLDRCGNLAPPPGFDPRTVHPVASYITQPTACSLTEIIYMLFLNCATDVMAPYISKAWNLGAAGFSNEFMTKF